MQADTIRAETTHENSGKPETIKLSVIIVNYNVKYFLEHALDAVRKASQNTDVEVFVVDNDSQDGSVDMVRQRYPEVNLLANEVNLGFAKANNQAIRQSVGEYVLLLNPDTVIEEDTFEKCVAFMETHPDAGALGVKMVDGSGRFLPESKRGLPTPAVAFYKVFGLSSLFPKSKVFSKYTLGHLDENETHEVDVLAGAFMMIRRSALDKAGLLDETFFMYGEDIDLSYRIQQAGFKNYYYPEARIIHYKGESTKKGSLNYVRMFYQAMGIFAKKHFSPGLAGFYSVFIQVAIFFRAAVTLVNSFVRSTYLVWIDAAAIFGGIYLIKEFWATNVKNAPTYYPQEFLSMIIPMYLAIWLLSSFLSGGYDKPYRITKALRGVIFGTLIIAAVYGFLPEQYRYSRAIILLGAAWTGGVMVLTRFLHTLFVHGDLTIEQDLQRKVAIVGSSAEQQKTLGLIQQSDPNAQVIGYVEPGSLLSEDSDALGSLDELPDIVDVYGIHELVFCARDIPASSIIHWMTMLGPKKHYKIMPEKGLSIIGSHSKDTSGDLYAIDINLRIDTTQSRRNKRLFDLLAALAMTPLLPAMLFKQRPTAGAWISVLFGKKSWVGYAGDAEQLPQIRQGVFTPLDGLPPKQLSSATVQRLDLLYARDYTLEKDWQILWRGFFSKRTAS